MGTYISQPASTGYWVLAGETILTVAGADIDLPAIPAGYRMLIVEWVGSNSTATSNAVAYFNNDSGANYYYEYLDANGGAVASGTTGAVAGAGISGGITTTGLSSGFMQIWQMPSGAVKSWYASGGSTANARVHTGYWNNTTEISRITLHMGANNWTVGSRITVYGVK
jgi:hypothetical protein